MSVKTKLRPLTVEEYLAGELRSDVKHELVGGQAYAIVGASNIHNQIAIALVSALRTHLRGGACRAYMSDMKVRVGNDFYYPDVVVSCTATTGPFYFIDNPVLIVEVLSPTTERQDRLEKRLAYQRLDSLQEYILIAQDKMQAEAHRRIEGGWELEHLGEHDVLRLEAFDFQMPVEEIYRDVMDMS